MEVRLSLVQGYLVANRVATIRELRTVFGFGLREAKDIADGLFSGKEFVHTDSVPLPPAHVLSSLRSVYGIAVTDISKNNMSANIDAADVLDSLRDVACVAIKRDGMEELAKEIIILIAKYK
ncbi:MAG: hypothetical protein BV459_00225 [Thermoplasmata archaeon M11B2D]|nr:MAG: hypothetical protein BV459_00225 [Thermoplasmata archaeon M11B2D]